MAQLNAIASVINTGVCITLENIQLMSQFIENKKELSDLASKIVKLKNTIKRLQKPVSIKKTSSLQSMTLDQEVIMLEREIAKTEQLLEVQKNALEIYKHSKPLFSLIETRDLMSQKNKQFADELLQVCGTDELFNLLEKLVSKAKKFKDCLISKAKLTETYNENKIAWEKGIKKFTKRVEYIHGLYEDPYFKCSDTRRMLSKSEEQLGKLDDKLRWAQDDFEEELRFYDPHIEMLESELDAIIEETKIHFFIDSNLDTRLRESTF